MNEFEERKDNDLIYIFQDGHRGLREFRKKEANNGNCIMFRKYYYNSRKHTAHKRIAKRW